MNKTEANKKIIELRRKWRSGEMVERNGITTPSEGGGKYRNYLSQDVWNSVDEFLNENGMMLRRSLIGTELSVAIVDKDNSIVFERAMMSIGGFNNMADFGSRITYCTKYLISIVAGIPVDTEDIVELKETTLKETTLKETTTDGEEEEEEEEKSEVYNKVIKLYEKGQKEEHFKNLIEKVKSSSKFSEGEKEELLAKISKKIK